MKCKCGKEMILIHSNPNGVFIIAWCEICGRVLDQQKFLSNQKVIDYWYEPKNVSF